MKNKEIPKGVRDLLPDEVKVKRNIEQKAAEVFSSYGYQEVITPTFEFLEVMEQGRGKDNREELFLFMDREGGILSLRPEMTVSIARLAATHLKDVEYPQRLFYIGNVFRHVQPHLAQYREFWELGVELLGAATPLADAEVINIAVKVLKEFGLKDFKVSLNHVEIFNSLLEESGLSADEKQLIRHLVVIKDLVELSNVLEKLSINEELKETIGMLPILHGGLEILEKVPYIQKNQKASKAVQELINVYEALKAFGVEDNIVLDMGVLRGLDYYTGIVFEGYSPELGYGLLGGGRYDNLLEQFGFSCPATGFALGIDRLALILDKNGSEPKYYLVAGQDINLVVTKAEELRQKGYNVQIDVEGRSVEELEKIATAKNNCTLVYVDKD
ncbi:ATP phosphoribosyltransferase regulatory subunit [Candidatus Syntrophocurvum alkaliphilum]|uniref:ATP phosphoribosyltransferase regulatory subunit n=1 Tax=Candidatus Syntrophocurvum alkaliphilum TaxID=2293317 RepID=A0A6I6DBN1_9FIRM|nr:ATP phosphoribosyltransferase regulatory subunit [Candidatus Syntrophocurvum alkaliphilum]QGT98815.1 ATP phosphoribosyltransferase regulatory subunit [Candidatus Syntrophocurvum alkaliphilum]